jgi:uncharacterized membrane protein YedE/YeeE
MSQARTIDGHAQDDRAFKPADGYANPYVAGIGLGLVLLAAFVFVGRGLGASGAFASAVTWVVNGISPSHAANNPYLSNYLGADGASALKAWLVFEVVGVFAGALISGLLAGRVRLAADKGPRVSTALRLVTAFAGGILIALGAAFARGCMSGQALSGGALLNAGAWLTMIMIFVGAYALAYFLRWQWR